MKRKKQPPTGPAVMVWAFFFVLLSCLVEPDYLVFVWVIIPSLYVLSRS